MSPQRRYATGSVHDEAPSIPLFPSAGADVCRVRDGRSLHTGLRMKPRLQIVRSCLAAGSPRRASAAAGGQSLTDRNTDACDRHRGRHSAGPFRSERRAFDAAARGRRMPALRNAPTQPHSVIRDAGSGFTASARRAAPCAATTAMTRFTRSAA